MKASWKGRVIAESDQTVVVEGNHYFPLAAVNRTYMQESATQTVCPWKGTASYYDVVVDGKINKDAAWFYSSPSDAARSISGHVAFWRGVEISA
jgi:uncharacterized protein (DUF427 family)